MRLDKQQLGLHLGWAVGSSLIMLGLAAWYTVASYQAGVWLQGGSLPALACGITAGLVILFELLLGVRKGLRAWRLLPARYWLAAHLWLGLMVLPLGFLHSGFRFGGWLPSILLLVLSVTYASGLCGWFIQHVIPSMMLKLVPSETITAQIDSVSRQNLADLRQMLIGAFGPNPQLSGAVANEPATTRAADRWPGSPVSHERALTIGAMRGSQRVSSVPAIRCEPDPVDKERVWQAYQAMTEYVLDGKRSKSWLVHRPTAEAYFANLTQACDKSTQPIVAIMKSICDQRREFDTQRRLNTWLIAWIPLHVGLGSALGVLLVVHIVTALRYW